MKVTIKTAHGYLSFQPDGRIEYRDEAASWETLDVWVQDALGVPPDGTQPPPAPNPSMLFPLEPTAAFVGRVKAWLLGQGRDLTGPCGAFLITSYVAWLLPAQSPRVGLLDKPGGNNCRGYATDIIVFEDGSYVDMLGDGGGANTPQWRHASDVLPRDRWRPPINPEA